MSEGNGIAPDADDATGATLPTMEDVENLRAALNAGDAAYDKSAAGLRTSDTPPDVCADDGPRVPIWRNDDGTYGGIVSVPCAPHPTPLNPKNLDFHAFARSGFLFLSTDENLPHPIEANHVIGIPEGEPILYAHDAEIEAVLLRIRRGPPPGHADVPLPCWVMNFKVIEGTPATKLLLLAGIDKFYLAFGAGYRDKKTGDVTVDRVGLFPFGPAVVRGS